MTFINSGHNIDGRVTSIRKRGVSPFEFDAQWDGTDGATAYTELSRFNVVATFNGVAELDTAKFFSGVSSLLANAAGAYVTFPTIAAYDLGAANFSWKLAVNFTAIGTSQSLISIRGTTSTRSYTVFHVGSSNNLRFQYHDGTIAVNVDRAFTPTLDQWYEIEVKRVEDIGTLLVDDTPLGATFSLTGVIIDPPTNVLSIGSSWNGAAFTLNSTGHIDSCRLTI